MNTIITEAKAEFTRAHDRIIKALNNTPEDKINWSPSSTSRTPIQLVVHVAIGTQVIRDLIEGKPFPFSSMSEMDVNSRQKEKEYTDKEQAIAFLNESSSEFLGWLDSVTEEQLASMATLPMATMPMTVAITLPADHIRSHASQLDYIQTVYGDNEFYM